MITERLTRSGFQFAAKNTRVAINEALVRLLKKDAIDLVQEGRGRKPAIYRVRNTLRGRHAAIAAPSAFVNSGVEVEDEAEAAS